MNIKRIIIIIISLSIFSVIFAEERLNEILENKLIEYNKQRNGYTQDIDIGKETEIVLYKTFYNNVLIGIDSIFSLNEYLEKDKGNYIKTLFNESLSKMRREQSNNTGLIADIELPVTYGALGSFLGEGGKLTVDGSERIEFSGSKTFSNDTTYTAVGIARWFPELDIYQHLIVNVTGTVGEKISVNLKHDSETEKESDNKVKIEYKGSEDDILQKIEAGDVSLALPGIKLIGSLPEHKGLFGIKTSGQLGGLRFTAIASKETGETNSNTFTGNTKKDSIIRYDIEFARNKFFYTGILSTDSIIDFIVYKDDGNGYNNEVDGAVPGNLLLITSNNDSILYSGFFNELVQGELNDYLLGPGGTYIEFNNEIGIQEAVGIAYIVKHSDGTIDTVGSIDYNEGDTLKLQALKLKEDFYGSPTWDYMMMNVYTFNASNIMTDSFAIKIYKVNYSSGEDDEIENDKTYLSLLGLDNNLDGIVDYNFINFERGYIIFPDKWPFANSNLEEPDSIIYTTDETGADIGRLYYLQIEYRGVQNVYSLGVFNILEGSEIVKVNDEVLIRDVDYTIDYEYGIITFLTDKVNSPNANIVIDYQYTPFLSLASKNLMGLHLDYNLSDKLIMNSNWLYSTLSYKLEDYPRLGEEPQEALGGEFDLSYNNRFYRFLDLINLLPFYNNDEALEFSFNAKAGISYPNPNSTGKAYIENMESVLLENNISMDRKTWYFGSLITGYDMNDLSYEYMWFNTREQLGDINDQLPDQDQSNSVSIMNLIMDPDNNANTFVTLNQTISKMGIDFSDMKFLQVWVKGDNGELIVDIGKNIPEDMLMRDKDGNLRGIDTLNTEDANLDGILDSDEDVGLDGVKGTDGQNVSGDYNNDDYYYSLEHPNDYSKINGTENNNILDTEDKNGDLQLNTSTDVYRFTIDLSSDENLVYMHPTSGWKLYRIPLNSTDVQIIGNPDLKYIKSSRIVWHNITSTDTLQFYQISIVSNKWKNFYTINSTEEKFWTGAKNNQTDMDYIPPFDPGYDYTGKAKKEQSMVLYCDNLLNNEGGKVYKILSKKESYERYDSLSFYVKSTESDSLDFYLKFGGDSLNYYFIKVKPVYDWQMIKIDLNELVEFKREHSDTNTYSNSLYGFYGSPSLTNIGYIELMVMNNSQQSVTTEIWVDDIMLNNPKRELGEAGDLSMNFSIPQLWNIALNGSYKDPFFKRITDKYGSGNKSKNYRFSTSFNTEKLFPEILGIAMPLSYSYSKSENIPLYKVGSDYYLDANESMENTSVNKSQNVSFRFSRNKKSANPFVHYSFDNLSSNFNYSNSNNYSYNRIDTSFSYSTNVNYAFNKSIKPIKLFKKLDYYYFPSNLSYSVGYNRNFRTSYVLSEDSFVNVGNNESKNISRNFTGHYKIFNSLSLSYSERRTNDPEFDADNDAYLYFLGRDIGKSQNVSIQYNPQFIKILRHNFNISTNYSDLTNPRIITVADSNKITNLNNNGKFSVNGSFEYPKIIKWFGSLRNEEKDKDVIKGSPHWIAMKLEEISRMFQPFSFNYAISRASSYSYVSGRAPWQYQIGIIDTLENNYLSDYTQYNKSSSYNYSFSSGMNFFKFSVNSSYSFSYNESGVQDNININENERWPNVSVSMNGLEDYFIFKKFFRNLSLRNSYNKTISSQGAKDEDYDRIMTQESFSPLIGIDGTLKSRINLSYSFNTSQSLTDNLGTIHTLRQGNTKNHIFSFSYSFSSPRGMKVPIIKKRIKFKSNLNLGVTVNYSENKDKNITIESDSTETNTEENGDDLLSHSTTLSITPKADYNFSNNVSGGLNMSYIRVNNIKMGDIRETFSMGIWVLFRF